MINPIECKARRTVSIAGTARPSAMQGYEFTIEQIAGDCYVDKDGEFHLIKNCELLPVIDPEHRGGVTDRAWTLDRASKPHRRPDGVIHSGWIGEKREPIKPGRYGIVHVYHQRSHLAGTADLRIMSDAATADELTEAAHLFNQLAEQLSAQPAPLPLPERVYQSPLKAAEAYQQAVRLLHAIHNKHWPELPPIEPLDTLSGVLSQIDHIIASLVRRYEPDPQPLPVTVEQPPAIEIKLSPRVDKAIADQVKQVVQEVLIDQPHPMPFEAMFIVKNGVTSLSPELRALINGEIKEAAERVGMSVADQLAPSVRKTIVELVQDTVNKLMADYEPKLRNT